MTDENENFEVVTADPMIELGQMPLLDEKQMENLAKRVEQQKQIKQLVLRSTSLRHWIVMGDNPYLNEAGTKIIASFFGLGIKNEIPEEVAERDDQGDYYSYTTLCEVTKGGRSVCELGYADSRDDFFSHGGKLPQSEIKKGNIKKKSITNAMGRAIKAFLGLDFTREEVEKAVGSLGKASGVGYKGKAKEELTSDDVRARNDLKGKIWLMCNKDVTTVKAYLKKLTAWPEKDFAGHEDFDKISMKSLKMKSKTIVSHYMDWEVNQKEKKDEGKK